MADGSDKGRKYPYHNTADAMVCKSRWLSQTGPVSAWCWKKSPFFTRLDDTFTVRNFRRFHVFLVSRKTLGMPRQQQRSFFDRHSLDAQGVSLVIPPCLTFTPPFCVMVEGAPKPHAEDWQNVLALKVTRTRLLHNLSPPHPSRSCIDTNTSFYANWRRWTALLTITKGGHRYCVCGTYATLSHVRSSFSVSQ